jgi:hypothetical protein
MDLAPGTKRISVRLDETMDHSFKMVTECTLLLMRS